MKTPKKPSFARLSPLAKGRIVGMRETGMERKAIRLKVKKKDGRPPALRGVDEVLQRFKEDPNWDGVELGLYVTIPVLVWIVSVWAPGRERRGKMDGGGASIWLAGPAAGGLADSLAGCLAGSLAGSVGEPLVQNNYTTTTQQPTQQLHNNS